MVCAISDHQIAVPVGAVLCCCRLCRHSSCSSEPCSTHKMNAANKLEDFGEVVRGVRSVFESGRTMCVEWRLSQLRSLLRMYEENNELILDALRMDMSKSKLEGYLYEVDLMKNDVRGAIRNLKQWTRDVSVPRNILTPADKAYYTREPFGVVLILSPWNYPFQLSLVPLCGAISGGNCAVVKPSELAPHSASVIARLVPMYLDSECFKVVLGGPTETGLLLDVKFDYIFYTGSMHVGRIVHAKANRWLTPVTLELGGKSPCYVDETVDVRMTAERLVWGKCMNMGQSCVAPDYVLCRKEVEVELVRECRAVMDRWYGTDWKKASDLARIVNLRHFDRVRGLIEGTKRGEIVMGGGFDRGDLWIEPTIVVGCEEGDGIMEEEIFGPVLAFMTVRDEDHALQFIKGRKEKPLCLYVFSSLESTQLRFKRETRSGTMVFNDTIIQFAIDELPFGGVGSSGMGSYHGKFSFDTFTHAKSIVKRDFSRIGDKVGMFRYPPYSKVKIDFLSFLLCHWKKFKFVYFDYIPHLMCFMFGVLVTVFLMSQ